VQDPVVAPALLLAGLFLLDGQSLTRREQKPTGVWFQPQLRFNALQVLLGKPPGYPGYYIAGSDAFPVGLEVGRQPWRRVMLSAAIAYDPSPNYRTLEFTAGARRYLREGALAPYLVAEVGVLDASLHTNVFAVAGAGLELTLENGLSLMTDLQLGPEISGSDIPWGQRTWYFSAWYRLGVGYRF
jgi:hypothetical protein